MLLLVYCELAADQTEDRAAENRAGAAPAATPSSIATAKNAARERASLDYRAWRTWLSAFSSSAAFLPPASADSTPQRVLWFSLVVWSGAAWPPMPPLTAPAMLWPQP